MENPCSSNASPLATLSTALIAHPTPPFVEAKGYLTRFIRHLILQRLRGLTRGRVTVIDAQGNYTFGQMDADPLHTTTVRVYHPNTYRRFALRGTIGIAEAYMAGELAADDLTTLIRIFVLNWEWLTQLEHGWPRFAMLIFRMLHLWRRNTRRGSRANIAAHYDLGNDFYQLFLDDTLTYSCALFTHADMPLREASIAKLDRLCQKLQLKSTDHVLEIGSGWGSFAIHAATHYDCRVTTTTISRRQYEFVVARVQQAGLADRVTVLCEDYRDLSGQFDKLVSIEMIEAVGQRYFETYFQVCSQLLKPNGLMALQAIVMADRYYEQMRRAVDFIQHYIFPGGCLPSLAAISQAVARKTDLQLYHLEDIGLHYTTTLKQWRQRFFANLEQIRALGFSDSFIRMWEFYLCYCEGGFYERTISAVQMLLTKPDCRREPLLPELLPCNSVTK